MVWRNSSNHLLPGRLFDDAGHRMIPSHATKAGIRYRYYASTPVLHGEAKTASAGSISRVPAADIEDTIVKSLEAHLASKHDGSNPVRCSYETAGPSNNWSQELLCTETN